MNRSCHQSRDYQPAGVGVPPSIPRCHARAPEPAGSYHPPLTPALWALLGPKQCNTMIGMAMALTAGTCRWVSTAPDGTSGTTTRRSPRVPWVFSTMQCFDFPTDQAVQMGLQAIGLDPPCPKVFASTPSTHGRNLPLCKFESR